MPSPDLTLSARLRSSSVCAAPVAMAVNVTVSPGEYEEGNATSLSPAATSRAPMSIVYDAFAARNVTRPGSV